MTLMSTKTPIPPPRTRTTYRSVFAVAEFRVLFAAQLMYVLGFEFEILGLSVLVFVQTRSAFLTALAFSMGFAPQAVGGALFGSAADRLPPRMVIWAGLLIRAAPGLVIGLRPGLPVPVMLALVAIVATVAPVFAAATSSLLPDVLGGDRYVLGRSIFNLTGSGTQIIGLGIGGAVLAAVPARWLLLAAGVCMSLAAAVARLGLRARAARARHVKAGGIISATMAGNVELLADRTVRGLLLAQWLPVWFVAGAESLIVPYTGSLGRPASAAGPLLAAMPAGMLLGEVLVGRFCPADRRRRLAFPLAAGMGIPLLALLFRPPLPLAGACLLFSGFGFVSSRLSSAACRNGCVGRPSASTRPGRWAGRACSRWPPAAWPRLSAPEPRWRSRARPLYSPPSRCTARSLATGTLPAEVAQREDLSAVLRLLLTSLTPEP
jgi:MFS family permease